MEFEGLRDIFTEEVAQNFADVGFAVLDNVFDKNYCMSFQKEIKFLYEQGMLYSNKTYYSPKITNGKVEYEYSISKPNIFELDLLYPQTREKVPHLNKLYEDKTLSECLGDIFPTMMIEHMDLKVQYNKGDGGCFPMHFDTTQDASKRQITCILYLNEGWEDGYGGELRLFPFPYAHVDIPPVMGRMVIFSSHQLLHRVMPSNMPRYKAYFHLSSVAIQFDTYNARSLL